MATKRTVPDITEIDLSKDGDICNKTELQDYYQQPYYCASRKAVGLDKLFVLHMDCNWQVNRLATALSNNSIHLTSIDTLEKVSTFIAHDDTIVDVHFSPVDANTLFTASSDGTVKVWDARNLQKHTMEFKGDGDHHAKPLMSFDVNCKGQFLCAGTEKIKQDSYLLVWDLRSNTLVTTYSESHDDDVSNIQFHPTEPNTLVSCSTDCLVNVFDISQTVEDDALQFSLNTETSCGRLQWLEKGKSGHNYVSVITHTEEIQIWDIEEGSPQYSFSREQIKVALKRKNTETCYAIRCFNTGVGVDPLVLAGSSTPSRGCLRLLQVKGDSLEPHAILYDHNGANSQVVRCAAMNPSDGTIVSGGEDGIINVWMRGEEKPVSVSNPMVEIPSKKSHKGRSNAKKPYAK